MADTLKSQQKSDLGLAFESDRGGNGDGWIETVQKSTSGSRLKTREVEVVAGASKQSNKPPPACIWMRGRWRSRWANILRLTFSSEGG